MWLLYKKLDNLLLIFPPFFYFEIMDKFVKFYYFKKKPLHQLVRICGGYILQTSTFFAKCHPKASIYLKKKEYIDINMNYNLDYFYIILINININ